MLASVSSWRGAYLAVAVASLAVVAVLRLWVLDDTQSRAERFTPASLLSAYQPLLRSHSMLRILSASTLRATSWVALLTYLGAFLGDTLDLGVREIGWAYMLGGAGYFAGTKLAGMRLGGVSLHALYGSSTLAMGTLVAMALLLPSSGFQIAIALVVASACSGIGWVTLVTLLMDETPAGQASTMSLNAVVFSIGASVGTLTGGGLLTFGGYAALGIGLLVFSAASSVLVWQPAHLSAESS
jgi:predicted MFS family arabinose efflux permease